MACNTERDRWLKCKGPIVRFVVLIVLAKTCSSRPLRQPLNASSQSSMAWSTSITATTELMIPVVDAGLRAQQGPCAEHTDDMVQLHFTVHFTRNPPAAAERTAATTAAAAATAAAGPAGSSSNPVTATVSTTFQQGDGKQLILQPCRVEQEEQQPIDHLVLQDSQAFSYTAYFRPLAREMCGKVPKAIIVAAIESTSDNQPPQNYSSEVDLVLFGCSFLIGDATADAPSPPAGMPQQKMTPASRMSSMAAAAAPVLM